jgi:hypothetical protein
MIPRFVEGVLLLANLVVAFQIGRGHRLLTSTETQRKTGTRPWDFTR